MSFLSRLLHGLFVRAENAELRATVAALRKAGHAIHPEITLGRRVIVRVEKGGTLSIGRGADVFQDSMILVGKDDTLTIGENVFISQHCTVSGNVAIGADTLIAGFVTILDANHRMEEATRPIREQGGVQRRIHIGSDVWIGAMVVVLPGVTIGDHAVIGANSTVTEDIPPWAIAVGSPARVIKYRDH